MVELSEDAECLMCGSDRIEYLGNLGILDWFRCKACGIDFSMPAEPNPDHEETERNDTGD